MGHDISAYIKTKSTPKDSFENEIAYFRIGAFNTSRQRLFYGILPNATGANAGVSGDGSTLDFTEEEIKQAIAACKYFMDDDSALREHLLEQKMEAEDSIKAFAEVFQQIAPNIKKLTTKEDISIEDARENLASIWKFHEDILSAYNDVKATDDSAHIQIYFG
jgi:predicted RNase H-like HicB family nuclease